MDVVLEAVKRGESKEEFASVLGDEVAEGCGMEHVVDAAAVDAAA